MVPQADGELELRDYLRVLRRRKFTIIAATLAVVAISSVASILQTPIYRATADVLLQPRSTETLFDPTLGQAARVALSAPTEIRVLESEPVRRLVSEEIGGRAPAVSVSNPAETAFLVVAAESSDPKRAAVIANAYAAAYVDFRRTQAVQEIQGAVTPLEARVRELDAQIAAAGPSAANLESLRRDRDLFASRVDQLKLAATQKTGGAQVVTPATAPETPVRPTPARNAVVALFVGLILGVGLAFLFDYLDDSLTTKEDVERAAPGVPVLGLIPALGGWKDKKSPVVVSMSDPKSPAAEAYRTLRTSVQFIGLDRPLRTVQVTSASAGEGKSTTIANLAVILAGAGQRVVVVDCDLRRPRIHHFFGLDHEIGVTSVLVGDTKLTDALQPVPAVKGLHLLASGPIPPNPSELLASSRMGDLLETLGTHCDMVLIDCPPMLPVTDASVLAPRVDGTLLVATAGGTEQRNLRRAVELLGRVNAPLLGIVFNGVSDQGAYGYRYGYRYAYAAEPPSGTGRPPAKNGAEHKPGRNGAVSSASGARSSGGTPPRDPGNP